MAVVLLVAALTASCTGGEDGADPDPGAAATTTGATAPVATTTTAATITTVAPTVTTLTLDPVEALAASGPVVLSFSWDAGSGTLSSSAPTAEVALFEATEITFTYPAESIDPQPVTWTQPVSPGDDVIVVQPWRRSPPADAAGDLVLVWQALGDRASYRAQLDAAVGVTVTSPVWWFIRADGTLADDSNRGFVDDAHARGLAVWPAVASLDADANHAAFADPATRTELAAAIAARAAAIGADGVNVDVEGYREEDAAAVTAFVTELAGLVHGWGGVVSYDLIPRTDVWEVMPNELSFWSTAPQRMELAAAVDYTVIMAYDQYNRYRPAGPVAAPGWVDEVVAYALRHVDPHRLILGVPFYGRVWDPADLERPSAVGIGRLAALAGEGVSTPDPATGLDRVDLPDGRFLWRETPEVLAERLLMVEDLGLAGWAAWRLGFDSPEVWMAVEAVR